MNRLRRPRNPDLTWAIRVNTMADGFQNSVGHVIADAARSSEYRIRNID